MSTKTFYARISSILWDKTESIRAMIPPVGNNYTVIRITLFFLSKKDYDAISLNNKALSACNRCPILDVQQQGYREFWTQELFHKSLEVSLKAFCLSIHPGGVRSTHVTFTDFLTPFHRIRRLSIFTNLEIQRRH